MLEILGSDHAAHDGQWFANALVDLDRNKTNPGILLLPPDQMGP